ncbi:MAG: hypothetical protein K8J08_19060 [Thermoanaerobaculia bacterium]|nr:hypothetical protein [Thermoanaerobaculia bacterium]
MTYETATLPRLSPALPGLTLAVLTLLFGFSLGGLFGLNEDVIKSRLTASAAAVQASVYQGDDVAAKAVVSKSWTYMQRAHLHAGSLGTAAVTLTLLIVLLGTSPRVTRAISLGLGVGALGYSVFWMWAGFRAPALGSTGAAKESLRWLAIPSAGLILVATAAVVLLCVLALRRSPQP